MDEIRSDEPEGAPARAPNAGAPSGGAGPEPERRFSAPRKLAAVTRLLRGEPLETLTRELNVTAARLSEWRDRALAGAEAAMKERERDGREGRRHRLRPAPAEGQARRGHHGQRAAGAEGRRPGGWAPFGPPEVEAVVQGTALNG